MKKLAMALALTASMAMASVCAAAGEGAALTKEQKALELFANGLNGVATVTYEQAAATLVPETKTKITAEAYKNLQNSVKEKLGSCSEFHFRTFERLNEKVDRVIYIGKYSKQELVAMVFAFDNSGKIIDFNLAPVPKQQPKQEAPAQEAPKTEE